MDPFLILIALVVFMLLLPPILDPAIRIKTRQIVNGTHPESRGAQWLAWYKEPLSLRHNWLAKETGDDDPYGWYYTKRREEAYRFSSAQAAKDRLPCYDGSSKIEERTGVEMA